MTIESILPLLKDPKPDGKGGYMAFCPCHADGVKHGRRSLHVQEKNGKLLLYCFAGCRYEDIKHALGLDQKEQGHGKEPEAVYDYRDENGKLLYQVLRFPGKRFRQRRPDGAGGWIYNLKGVKRVLYHLSDVLKAVRNGEMIFIVEGEKDVDNLARLGLIATTAPGGAGKWLPDYSETLLGATVTIIPDYDEPGRKHAQRVAEALKGKAVSIKVLELPGLPEKGDASDWLFAGGTKDELLRLAAEAPEWEPPKQEKREKAGEDEERKPTRQTSFYIDGKILLEQIYCNGTSLFMAYDTATGETKPIPFLELEEEIIEPINGEDVELGAVKLPSGVSEYGDTMTLLAEIEELIRKYLDVSPNYLKFAAYYVLLSWVYDRFHTLPYLRALGDTGCGKSRFLDVIGGLCYKSISASGCVTPAPIYRMLRKWSGTLVLDEADMKNSDEYNEVVTILNCGFERGRPVIRATKDNPDKVQILPVYGPKVFATRRRFKDVALEARCLTEIMRETDRDDIPPVLGRKFFEEQQELRNKLLLFRFRNYFKVDPEAGANLDLGNIEPRLRQVSEAFISLFANEPEVLESYKEFILNHQRELIEQRAATKTGQVVEKLFELIGNKVTLVTSVTGDNFIDVTAKDIAEKVGLAAQAVGQILKGLGLKTKLAKINGASKRRIVYNPAIFNKLRKRYILDDDLAGNPVTNVTNVTLVTEPETLGTLEYGGEVF